LHFFAAFILSSNVGLPGLVCLLGVGGGLYLFYRGFLLLQRRRLILDTPFSKIRSAAMGMVEVSGLAVGPYTMTAPITARSCYFYRTQAWELKQRGKNKEWVQVAKECNHIPFFLDDHTGRVLVDPREAELDLYCDFQQEFCDSFFSVKEPAPANVRDFLARHGVETSNKIRVEEHCIKPKNALFILGTLVENKNIEVSPEPIANAEANVARPALARVSMGASGLVSSVFTFEKSEDNIDTRFAMSMAGRPEQKVIRLSGAAVATSSTEMSQQEKIAAAMVKAGIRNPAAWAAAGLDRGAVAVSENSGDQDGFEQHPAVVLTKGTKNKEFMISWRSQREVAGSLAWKCMVMIWGGPVLAVVSLYALVGMLRAV
jgi:E3 Ubiquitin ligase